MVTHSQEQMWALYNGFLADTAHSGAVPRLEGLGTFAGWGDEARLRGLIHATYDTPNLKLLAVAGLHQEVTIPDLLEVQNVEDLTGLLGPQRASLLQSTGVHMAVTTKSSTMQEQARLVAQAINSHNIGSFGLVMTGWSMALGYALLSQALLAENCMTTLIPITLPVSMRSRLTTDELAWHAAERLSGEWSQHPHLLTEIFKRMQRTLLHSSIYQTE